MDDVRYANDTDQHASGRLLRMATVAADMPHDRRRWVILGLVRERHRHAAPTEDFQSLRHLTPEHEQSRAPEPSSVTDLFKAAYCDPEGAEYWQAWVDAPPDPRALATLCAAHVAHDHIEYHRLVRGALAAFGAIRDGGSSRDAVQRVYNDINTRHLLPAGLIRQIGGAAPAVIEEAPLPAGKPGRPSAMALIRAEYHRRRAAGLCLPTSAAEARAIRQALLRRHPDLPVPTAKTIQNRLAGLRGAR